MGWRCSSCCWPPPRPSRAQHALQRASTALMPGPLNSRTIDLRASTTSSLRASWPSLFQQRRRRRQPADHRPEGGPAGVGHHLGEDPGPDIVPSGASTRPRRPWPSASRPCQPTSSATYGQQVASCPRGRRQGPDSMVAVIGDGPGDRGSPGVLHPLPGSHLLPGHPPLRTSASIATDQSGLPRCWCPRCCSSGSSPTWGGAAGRALRHAAPHQPHRAGGPHRRPWRSWGHDLSSHSGGRGPTWQ